MKLLNNLVVYHNHEQKFIELYRGDLSEFTTDGYTDLLIVSAFPNVYTPLKNTLIGALNEKGISIQKLAEDKEEDLRETYNCWLSKSLKDTGLVTQYDRILCFEPPTYDSCTDVIGDVFQSIMPIVNRNDIEFENVVMPLLATGLQGSDTFETFEVLIDAAVNWLAHGLPLKRIKIVEINELKAAELNGAFNIIKKKYDSFTRPKRKYKYDAFISYSHQNTEDVTLIKDTLLKMQPDLQLFFDRKDLYTGSAWQQELYDALDNCEKVVAFYSPTYLSSKVCKEEFNIAMFRHRDSENGVLVPVYLQTTELPTYMKVIQFIDIRNEYKEDLLSSCKKILTSLNK